MIQPGRFRILFNMIQRGDTLDMQRLDFVCLLVKAKITSHSYRYSRKCSY